MYKIVFVVFLALICFLDNISSYIINNRSFKHSTFSLNATNSFKSELLQELSNRNILDQLTDRSNIDELLSNYSRKNKPLSIYFGIDLTSSKIHIGTLFQLLTLRRFLSHGFDIVILLGMGTTKIGDPSFTSATRQPLHTQFANLLDNNKKFSYITQSHQLSYDNLLKERRNDLLSVIKFIMTRPFTYENQEFVPETEEYAEYNPDTAPKVWFVDNFDIHKNISLTEYLELVGNNFQLNRMLSRDSISKRLNIDLYSSGKAGMTLSELAYMTLQALDFVNLSQTFNARFQLGGADQWGNIISGVDLASMVLTDLGALSTPELYGITTKLILDSTGSKLSKSNWQSTSLGKDNNTIWLSLNTSALDLWQFFRNTNDENVSEFIRYFTDIPTEEADKMVESDINQAKKLLSDRITALLYGEASVSLINKFWAFNKDKPNILFNVDLLDSSNLDSKDFAEFLKYVTSIDVDKHALSEGLPVVEVLKLLGICDSNTSARNLIIHGKCYLNDKLCEPNTSVTEADIKSCEGEHFVFIRIGKKHLYALRVR